MSERERSQAVVLPLPLPLPRPAPAAPSEASKNDARRVARVASAELPASHLLRLLFPSP